MTSKDKVGNKDIEAASIAVIDYDDGAWGDVEVLVASQGGDDNNFFPAWSPDSAWIAYVNAQQKSKDAVTATIRLVSADGSIYRELSRLNGRVNAEDGVVDIGNAMPRWAPFQSIEDGNHRAFWTVSDEDRQQQCLCVDVCGDSIDNDGDELVDGADPSCIIVE